MFMAARLAASWVKRCRLCLGVSIARLFHTPHTMETIPTAKAVIPTTINTIDMQEKLTVFCLSTALRESNSWSIVRCVLCSSCLEGDLTVLARRKACSCSWNSNCFLRVSRPADREVSLRKISIASRLSTLWKNAPWQKVVPPANEFVSIDLRYASVCTSCCFSLAIWLSWLRSALVTLTNLACSCPNRLKQTGILNWASSLFAIVSYSLPGSHTVFQIFSNRA
mmetsp:Transcript_25965/g.51189  ORF Transcript_25965/g.51189 Transcript_25965/m.51189 type:complete len:224 (+) Transcript_25965:152-823(+)